LSGEESLIALKNCPPGTFLVRDSSDPDHLFSLSVQTTRGPTSVRLHYLNGEFRLDAQHHLAHHVPRFACVLRLIEHYVREGREEQRRRNSSTRTYVNVSPPPEPGSHVWVGLIFPFFLLRKLFLTRFVKI
jgi:SH2 domain